VFSTLALQFTSLRRKGGYRNCDSKTCAQGPQTHLAANTSSQEAGLEVAHCASHRLRDLFPLQPSGDETCCSPGRAGPLTTVPFTSRTPYCLNASVGQQTLFLFSSTSYGWLPPGFCGRMSQDYLNCDYFLFPSPQISTVSNNRPSLKMVSCYSSQK
jgi:hypothetical protein